MHWRQPQHEREHAFAEHFLELLDEGHESNSLRDSEAPDLLLESEGETIGIEIREVFRESGARLPIQAREGARQSVLLHCEREWKISDQPKVEVWLGFRSETHIPKARTAQVVDQILDIIADNLPPQGEYVRIHATSFPWGTFPEELRYVGISRLVEYQRSYWHVDGVGGWVPNLNPGKLQEEIDAKNAKLPAYREKTQTVWLLLVLHGWRVSSIMEVTNETKHHVYSFDFDRAFLLDTLGRNVHELRRS